jgi:hypothetical protein
VVTVSNSSPNLPICRVLALIPGFDVPPLNGGVGVLPIDKTEVYPVTAEKGVMVTIEEADVAEYGATINV